MKVHNKFVLWLSFMCGSFSYATAVEVNEHVAEIDMMDPSYVLTDQNVVDGIEGFSEEFFRREFRFIFDMSHASQEEIRKIVELTKKTRQIRKEIDFEEGMDKSFFKRFLDYYAKKSQLMDGVHQSLSNLYYSPYNSSRIDPESLVTSDKKVTLVFTMTIGVPNFLKPEQIKNLSEENLNDLGIVDLKSYIELYQDCLAKQAKNIADFVRENKTEIFVSDPDEPLVNGGMNALRFVGRYKRFFETERKIWSKLFTILDSERSKSVYIKIAMVRSEEAFEPYLSANVDIDCEIELSGISEELLDEENSDSDDEEEAFFDAEEVCETTKKERRAQQMIKNSNNYVSL